MVETSGAKQSRRPRISREFLDDHRRRRYVVAVAELLHEFGRKGPTVTNVVRLAGTARGSFYEVFRSGEECIAYGIAIAADELFAAFDAQDGEGEWFDEVDEAISGFYGAVAAEPIFAELLLIHSAASRLDQGGPAALAGAERFTELLRRGRAEADRRGRTLPATTEEYFSGVIVSLAARRLLSAETEELPQESRSIADMIGRFYLGSAAVRQILAGRAVAN